jgi:hypothetical protein
MVPQRFLGHGHRGHREHRPNDPEARGPPMPLWSPCSMALEDAQSHLPGHCSPAAVNVAPGPPARTRPAKMHATGRGHIDRRTASTPAMAAAAAKNIAKKSASYAHANPRLNKETPRQRVSHHHSQPPTAASNLPNIRQRRDTIATGYVEDVAEAIVRAARRAETNAITFECCGPRIYTYEELLRMLAREAGLKPILIPVPFAAWQALAWIAE